MGRTSHNVKHKLISAVIVLLQYITVLFVDINKKCIFANKEMSDRNAQHIKIFATIAKSLPHSLRKANNSLFLYITISLLYKKHLL